MAGLSALGVAAQDAGSERTPLLSSPLPRQDADGSPFDSSTAPQSSDRDNGQHWCDDEDAKAREDIAASRKRALMILPAVAIGIFMAAADQTIIASSYGRIGTDLEALDKTGWIATAYFLTLTSFQPLYGRLSDIFGRKPALLFAYAVFGLGCLWCGLAKDINQLIMARALSGIGGGGMTTVVAIIWSDILPVRERGMWQGFSNLVYALGSSLGGPMGGLLVDTPRVGWRWPFIIQAALALGASVSVFFTLKLPPKDLGDWRKNMQRIDLLGASILVLAVLALMVGFDRGASLSWGSPITVVFLISAVILLGVFGYVETFVASEPFTPNHIIFNPTLFAHYMVQLCSFISHISALFFVPLFFQAVHGLNSGQAAICLNPTVLSGVSGGLFGGIMAKWLRDYARLTMAAAVVLSLGSAFLVVCCAVDVGGLTGLIIGMSVNSFGNGIICTSTMVGILANSEPKDQAIATACSYLFRSLGSVIGVTVVSAIVQQSLRSRLIAQLSSRRDAEEIVRRVRISLDTIKQLDPETRELVRACYRVAVRDGMIVIAALASLTLVAAFFGRGKRLV